MIMVDEKQVLQMIKKHQFRDLKQLFSGECYFCGNCKFFSNKNRCEQLKLDVKENEFCCMWEKAE